MYKGTYSNVYCLRGIVSKFGIIINLVNISIIQFMYYKLECCKWNNTYEIVFTARFPNW